MIEQRDRRRDIGNFRLLLIDALVFRRFVRAVLRFIIAGEPRQAVCLRIGFLCSLLDHCLKLCIFIERGFELFDAAVVFRRQTVHLRFGHRRICMIENRHIDVDIMQLLALRHLDRLAVSGAENERDFLHLLFILASAAARRLDLRLGVLIGRRGQKRLLALAAADILLYIFDDVGGFLLLVIIILLFVEIVLFIIEVIDEAFIAACCCIDNAVPDPDERLCTDLEHLDDAAVRQQHNQHNDNQRNDDSCADNVKCSDERDNNDSGNQTAAAEILAVFKEQHDRLLEGHARAGCGIGAEQGIAEENLHERADKQRQQDAPDRSARGKAAAVLTDQIARVDQDCRNENHADAEGAEQHFMERQPEFAARNDCECSNQDACGKEQNRPKLIIRRLRRGRSGRSGLGGRLRRGCRCIDAACVCFPRRRLRCGFGRCLRRGFRCGFLCCLFCAGLSGCFLFSHGCTFLS